MPCSITLENLRITPLCAAQSNDCSVYEADGKTAGVIMFYRSANISCRVDTAQYANHSFAMLADVMPFSAQHANQANLYCTAEIAAQTAQERSQQQYFIDAKQAWLSQLSYSSQQQVLVPYQSIGAAFIAQQLIASAAVSIPQSNSAVGCRAAIQQSASLKTIFSTQAKLFINNVLCHILLLCSYAGTLTQMLLGSAAEDMSQGINTAENL